MLSASKQAFVNILVPAILNGTKRKDALATYAENWQMPTRTFDRYWTIANKEATQKLKEIDDKVQEGTITKTIEVHNDAVMTAQERREYLTQLIRGEIKFERTEVKWDPKTEKYVTIPIKESASAPARIASIMELNRMGGDHAPKKIAHVDPPEKSKYKEMPDQALQALIQKKLNIMSGE